MSWEERLLFLMFLDYKGVLKKWEKNHGNYKDYHRKIDHDEFGAFDGFSWYESKEGGTFWHDIIKDWNNRDPVASLSVASLKYTVKHKFTDSSLKVGCQTITKKDALKIADFIYECFGE